MNSWIKKIHSQHPSEVYTEENSDNFKPTEEETDETIGKLKKNKASESDSIPVEVSNMSVMD